jgi:O-antigen ligase
VINQKAQELLGRILTTGVLVVTLFVEAWKSSEPVNAPKMLVLSTIGISALFIIVTSWNREFWVRYRWTLIALSSFYSFSVFSVVISKDNALVGIFGIKGRSTGLVTYLSLVIIFLAAVLIQDLKQYDRIIKYLLIAGGVNIAYNTVYIFGYDPIPWSNPYGTFLGSFGNPNFISSFMGMLIPVLFALVLNKTTPRKIRIFSGLALPIVFYQIIYTHSIQGVFVSAVGVATVLFFYLRSEFKKKGILISYVLMVLILGLTSILGMLQKGPLASIIYKTSVSLRGEYWAAGINMGLNNPFTGVGLDSYGNWYRLYRRASAMILPGPSIVSDSAHNVFIDFFAGGGFPLLISYLAIQIMVGIAIWRIFKNLQTFSVTPIALIAAWLGYTSQSVISINQIGLAIWGWVFGGAIVGYSMLEVQLNQEITKSPKGLKVSKTSRSEAAVSLSAIAGLFVGFLIALPPVRTDMAWRSALKAGNAGAVEQAMRMWPHNQRTLNSGIVLFANNGLPEKALEWSRIDVKEYQESYVAWYTLYQLQGISQDEKATIYKKLHELDPLNPEFLK